MKHLINYKIFESKELDEIYKKHLDNREKYQSEKSLLKDKYRSDREKIFSELKERMDECMYDLTDNYEFSFSQPYEKYLVGEYYFRITSEEFNKFISDAKESISKLKSQDLFYFIQVNKYHFNHECNNISDVVRFFNSKEIKNWEKEYGDINYKNNITFYIGPSNDSLNKLRNN